MEAAMKPLTDEQNKVIEFIIQWGREKCAPPTVREICDGLGYKSINNARQHLRLIERKGYIRLLKGKARGIELLIDLHKNKHIEEFIHVPFIGTVAAGQPITAEENIEGHIALDRNLFRGEGLFTLRVKGDSMKNIGVLDGDIAIIRQQNNADNGEIVVAIIEGDATLKRYIKDDNSVILRAENPRYQDIVIPADRSVWIIGKMVGVIRKC